MVGSFNFYSIWHFSTLQHRDALSLWHLTEFDTMSTLFLGWEGALVQGFLATRVASVSSTSPETSAETENLTSLATAPRHALASTILLPHRLPRHHHQLARLVALRRLQRSASRGQDSPDDSHSRC